MNERIFRRLFAVAAVLLIGAAALLYYPPLVQNTLIETVQYTSQQDKLDLNTATAVQLSALPGIGQIKAKAIVQYREEHGAFTSAEQLLSVKGIGNHTLNKIKPYLIIDY